MDKKIIYKGLGEKRYKKGQKLTVDMQANTCQYVMYLS